AAGQVPEHRAPRQLELAVERRAQEVRVDVLEEQARTGFQRAPPEELEIAVGDRQVDAERVVGVQSGNDELVVDAITAAVAEAKRLGRGLGLRLPVRVRRLERQIQVLRELVAYGRVDIRTLVRR